jgi:hypothetical protein
MAEIMNVDIAMSSSVRLSCVDKAAYDEAIERVTGTEGDAWRKQAYDLHTENQVLEHWARNCIVGGVEDISTLDGWADVAPGTITMSVMEAWFDG